MIIKFLDEAATTYEVAEDCVLFENYEKIIFADSNIPAIAGGFTITRPLSEEEMYESDYYTRYVTPWEVTEDSITFSVDDNTYYVYYIVDNDNNVTGIYSTTSENEGGHLRACGKGKEYAQPEFQVVNAEGAYLYKLVNDELVETSEADKTSQLAREALAAIESAKAMKKEELNQACALAIQNGVTIGDDHFSYDKDDQSNLSSAIQLAIQTGLGVPYHADGQACKIFSPEDIMAIYIANESNLTHNVTYNNQLKMYVDSLASLSDIAAVVYGETQLTGEYKNVYDMVMAQANEVIKKFLEA